MKAFLVLMVAAAALTAGNARPGSSIPVPGAVDILQYDDGTAVWFTWGGLYRGVWFNVADFGAMPGASIGQLEFWFYHSTVYDWDTSSFYAEIWNGNSRGPLSELSQTSVMAVHNAPTYVSYTTPIWCGSNFWVLENTSLSNGGWPSLYGDNTAHPVSHSFYSDEFVEWEPWLVYGSTASDYLIRAHGGGTALARGSWGAIKTLF
jgi:hypothetical protein